MTETLDHMDAELGEYLSDDITVDFDGEPATLAGLADADRALWHIARLDRTLKRYEAVVRHTVDKAQAWLHGRSEIVLRERDYWERCVEGFMRAHHAETGVKTEKLPNGTLSLRKAQTKVEVDADPTDDAPAELVKVHRKWDRSVIKKATQTGPELDVDAPEGYTAHAAVTADGEVLPGVVLLVPDVDSFSVKAGE